MTTQSSTRYGIFLRPDARTCWAQAQINLALRQQFGLISAAAFPPHATLVGNLHTDLRPAEVIELLDPVFADRPAFEVHNAGVKRVGDCYLYDVHNDEAGEPNQPLLQIAHAAKAAVLPTSLDHGDHLVSEVRDTTFWAHLSLASHDLIVDPHLADEVGLFIDELPIDAPGSFDAEWFSLFEFTSEDWADEWWRTLTWRHLHSWQLKSGVENDR